VIKVDDFTIQQIIFALKERKNNIIKETDIAIQQVQEVCPHNQLDEVTFLRGKVKQCRVCGKYFEIE
jgi:hypothetical protein